MILPRYSCLLAGRIPHAEVIIYPDSAHGFPFQHHAEFAADVEAFLTGASLAPGRLREVKPGTFGAKIFHGPERTGCYAGTEAGAAQM